MHDPALSQTLDALRDAYLALFRGLEGSSGLASADEGDLAWGMTPLPIGAFNRVVHIRLTRQGADARLRNVEDRYRAAGVPESWWIDPLSTPSDLAERLERTGYVSEAVPAMRIEAGDVPELELPRGVTLSWATHPESVRAAMRLVGEGFGLPEELGRRMADLIAPLGRADGPIRTVVARLDDKAVAVAQGIDFGGAVGIYNVATLKPARGHGIGAAVTVAVLRDAVARGARFGVLESSDLGHPVYQRIGFRDVASFRVYGRPEA
jgi:GNAT superfamily N-acetyltransferase